MPCYSPSLADSPGQVQSADHIQSTFFLCSELFQMHLAVLSHTFTVKKKQKQKLPFNYPMEQSHDAFPPQALPTERTAQLQELAFLITATATSCYFMT